MKPTLWMSLPLLAAFGCGDMAQPKTAGNAPSKVREDTTLPLPSVSKQATKKNDDATANPFVIPPPPVAASNPASGQAGSSLVDVDLDGFDRKLAGFKGKIVVVDAWATWCVPCRAKFPKFVELAQKSGEKFAFASLAVDETSPDKAQFLSTEGANFLNLRLANVPSAQWQKKLGFDAVPHYLVYDAGGKLTFHTEKIEDLQSKLVELGK